jgi:hypothetical protein
LGVNEKNVSISLSSSVVESENGKKRIGEERKGKEWKVNERREERKTKTKKTKLCGLSP